MKTSQETAANTFSGYPVLVLLLAAMVLAVMALLRLGGGGGGFAVFTLIAMIVLWVFLIAGFYMLQPNNAAVITLFGSYRGTDRTNGLRWIWPWMGRHKISARAHNIHSEKVKINDLRGNPIDIACNVVWRVQDTAQAVFDVDDYKEFTNIQIEAGLRTVGARHPYDDMGEEDETTLRGSADVINAELQAELNDRLKVAGIVVDEAGLTHLAYASEIAGAMLRRQQAEAVIAARAKLVMGAVSMVEMALDKLKADNIVDLTPDQRADMVANLMVVLCGDRDAQPVVNTGKG
ncbi:SPFH domain-containing protein [Croceicoccus sp. Ery15]|uniref:SPFH domain-containing protein n=1 Tax=Croceicoccus sp. Ery15 TaxID=1703338 RepID=UPI001E3B2B42|nr:SPFH domain-containing protein [Croceicoccus sp. Ery15]